MKDDRTRKIREKKISVDAVVKGMYVARLDRPWTDLPFMFQGFVVQHESEIQVLQEFCQHVFVDVDLSPIDIEFAKPDYLAEFKLKGRKVDYTNQLEFEDELPTASMVFSQLDKINRIVRKEYLETDNINLKLVNTAVKRVVASVIRNPDPMLWMLHSRDPARYETHHALGSCVLTAAFGRFLGLPDSMIQAAAVAGLLADVGKLNLPKRVLHKTDKLSDGEFALVKEHVYMSLDALMRAQDVSRHTLDAVSGHHESLDGSGYPEGLRGTDISPYARMLAITDSYDAVTSHRPYAQGMTGQNALQHLFKGSEERFEKNMLEQFIQCMSSFPTGAIIELSTGEVGLVCSQHEKHRLRPKIRIVRDADKKILKNSVMLDLAETERDPDGKPLFIQRTHPIGSFDINREIYIP